MSILRNTAPLDCKFSGVWFRSSATAAEQRAVQLQWDDVKRRFTLTKKFLEIPRCQFHSGSIP